MKEKKKQVAKRKVSRGVLAVFLLLCVVIGTACFQYYSRLQVTIRAESSGYLQEISRRIGSNINRVIDDNYAVLRMMASTMGKQGAETFSDVRAVVSMQQSYWNYKDVLLIDEKGVAYDPRGGEIALSGDLYLRDAVVHRKSSMSMSQLIDGKERILFAIPLENIVIEGKTMMALATGYDPADFNEILAMTSFSEQAYSHIISKDGIIIVRSTAPTAFKTGYNLLSTLSASQMGAGYTMADLKDDMKNNRAGQIEFTTQGVRYYMVYTPVASEDWYLATFVPVSVVNERSDLLLSITLALCGGITLLFAGLVAFMLFTFYSNQRKLEQIAYVDEVTGGNTIQRFYEMAQQVLDEPGRPDYALVYTNLEKFKLLNEELGRHTCDQILWEFSRIITAGLAEQECIGRISADNFAILLCYSDEGTLIARFQSWYARLEDFIRESRPVWSMPVTQFGIYVITNDTMAFPLMIDRAKLALRESPHSVGAKMRYAIYDDDVRRRLMREKYLEDRMERALEDGEFQVYLQPKYRLSDEEVGGAEALVRWVSPEEGMIYPDEFIPLFERNGFVVEIDLWVFAEVCRTLRMWLDSGRTPVKISVNCSRVHLKDNTFLRRYQEIARQYAVPEDLLEIELTESVVIENTQRLGRVIDEIHAAGFGCSVDDFGSGYSSLNMIQDIPADTLKLDKIFFRSNARNALRTYSVVSNIISMAKALDMATVAEGVEYPEQVIMLRQAGCNLIQGYVFAKPMPIDVFERLLYTKDMDTVK